MASAKLRLKEIIICGVCFEVFNENLRCPRILLCGHTFCQSCLEKILKQLAKCPTCNAKIKIEKVELISINFAVKSMMTVAELDNTWELQKSLTSQLVISPCSSTRKLASEGYCSEHDNFQELRCMDCESWICGICATLHHKHCRHLLVKEAYEEHKKQATGKVENELKTMNSLSIEITKSLNILTKEREELIKEIKNKENELKNKEKSIEELNTIKSEGIQFCENLTNLKSLIENSTNNSEFSQFMGKIDDLLDQGRILIARMETLETLYPRTVVGLKHLCEGQYVYVVEIENGPLYGMVKVISGRIWISSFQTVKPEARLFPFKEFLSNFGCATELPTRAFLKITPIGDLNDEIEVIIETDGDSARVKNFILLCSALKGRKYKGMTIDTYSGHYQLDPGPHPVVKEIKDSEPKVIFKEGLVTGMQEGNSYFTLSLKDDSSYIEPKIGSIVSGLQKLQEFHGKKLIITDCGLII